MYFNVRQKKPALKFKNQFKKILFLFLIFDEIGYLNLRAKNELELHIFSKSVSSKTDGLFPFLFDQSIYLKLSIQILDLKLEFINTV